MEHQQNHHQEEDLSYRSLTGLSSNEKEDFRNPPTLVEPIIIKDKEGSFLLQSLLSNLIFLCAGTLYMIGSIWDITPPNDEETRANEVYNWIWRLAPITYLFNSMIDIKLADRIRRHRKKIKLVTASSSSSSDRNVRLIMSDGDERGLNNDNRNSFEKIRKHAAHRRELGAALSFFVAALYGTFVEIAEATGGDDMLLLFLDRVSIHSYLLSALLALAGSDIVKGKCRQLDFNDSASLENLGDVFFFIGSVVGKP